MIYLDNAATSGKKPETVINAVTETLKNLSVNAGRGGYEKSIKASELIYNTRVAVSDMFGADGAENVCFTQSCTYALNFVLKGILEKGDKVIISSLEHNAVARPVNKLEKEGIISYKVANVTNSDEETVNNFKKLIEPETRLVCCTAASNVTGKILPIEKIGKMCKNNGILFCVDAASAAGIIPIDMQKMNIDFLCIAPHKGLYAPMGTGILIARKPIKNTLIEGGTGSMSLSLNQPDEMPERFESGTLNLPGIAGIKAGIEYVNRLGTDKIYNHELQLIILAYGLLSKLPNVIFYTEKPAHNVYTPVLSFNIADTPSEKVADYLASKKTAVRAGLHCAPLAHLSLGTTDIGTVRISCGTFNKQSDIIQFVNLLKKY